MLELTSAGRPVQLPRSASVQLEYHSALFDEDIIKGEFSYSFPVPAPENGLLYGYPERLDRQGEPGAALPAELADDGLPLLVGQQRVTAASPKQYTVSLQNGLSGANLSGRPLSSFALGGLREVPRWVPVAGLAGVLMPGLTAHANAVAADADAYDYVFAPLRNEDATTTTDPADFPTAGVNAWFVSPTALLGMPAGGSFRYNIDLQVGGGVTPATYQPLPPMCPFPRLRYVLHAICAESGLDVDDAALLPGELGELVLVTSAQLLDRGDAQTLRFSLADVVPACTVAELLAALRQDLGIVLYQDPLSRRMRTAYLVERVALGEPAVDLTHLRAGLPTVSLEQPQGLTLTAHVDRDDALTKDYLSKQPAPDVLLPAVVTAADLPAAADLGQENPRTGQVRLVQAEATFYSCTVGASTDGVHVALTWAVLVPALLPIAVAGGGSEQAQHLSYTQQLATRGLVLTDPAVTMSLPALSQPPYRAEQEASKRPAALRLLFYNGLQLASDGVSRYPQLAHLSKSGQLSTRLGGEAGTYARLLSAWLLVKLRAAAYTQPLQLSSLELARLDMSRPLLLDGVRVLPRKLVATVPLRKPATLEVVRV